MKFLFLSMPCCLSAISAAVMEVMLESASDPESDENGPMPGTPPDDDPLEEPPWLPLGCGCGMRKPSGGGWYGGWPPRSTR